MNVVLLSPVDALVFDYVAFGIFTVVNNLWTWAAVLTAAISFWRFKSISPENTKPPCIDPVDIKEDPVLETASFKCSESTTLVSNGHSSVSEDNGVTKGKFVTFYYEDRVDNVNECDGDSNDEGEDSAFDERNKWRPERLLMRMRMEEMGWYSYQDLTVVNGNVVRLWDGSVRKEKLLYSSGCVVC